MLRKNLREHDQKAALSSETRESRKSLELAKIQLSVLAKTKKENKNSGLIIL